MSPNIPATARRRAGRALARAFSLVELMIALTISALMLSACLVALDGSFKSYERTAESASSHIVARLVMHRILGMIRQGEEFAPFDYDVLARPRVESDYIQFVSWQDPENPTTRDVTTVRRESDPDRPGAFRLGYVRERYVNAARVSIDEGVLLRHLRDARFTLEYDVGPRLVRATVDLTLLPDTAATNATAIGTNLDAKTLRLIASATPRRLDQ